jgi:hypothetical protein
VLARPLDAPPYGEQPLGPLGMPRRRSVLEKKRIIDQDQRGPKARGSSVGQRRFGGAH